MLLPAMLLPAMPPARPAATAAAVVSSCQSKSSCAACRRAAAAASAVASCSSPSSADVSSPAVGLDDDEEEEEEEEEEADGEDWAMPPSPAGACGVARAGSCRCGDGTNGGAEAASSMVFLGCAKPGLNGAGAGAGAGEARAAGEGAGEGAAEEAREEECGGAGLGYMGQRAAATDSAGARCDSIVSEP